MWPKSVEGIGHSVVVVLVGCGKPHRRGVGREGRVASCVQDQGVLAHRVSVRDLQAAQLDASVGEFVSRVKAKCIRRTFPKLISCPRYFRS